MATWKNYTVRRVIEEMESGKLLLPIIQRELVWDEEKIKNLFQTLCLGDSYGGIMIVRDEKGPSRSPMFQVRKFVPDYVKGNLYESQKIGFADQDIEYVIDGQQRLSSILMGVRGSYNGKRMYFNLLSDYGNNEYVFEFSKDVSLLPRTNKDEATDREYPTWWMAVSDLNDKMSMTPYQDDLIDVLLDDQELDDESRERARKNIGRIFAALRTDESVGLCQVHCVLKKKNGSLEDGLSENRLRIVNLFRKLNQGGTVLSGIELMRSTLKALSPENEHFLNEIRDKYAHIGLDQDGIIKYIFLLQDQVAKDITDVKKEDSDFIAVNKDRIFASLDALGRYLDVAKLKDFVVRSRPSTIPFYLLAYYLYHLSLSNDKLLEYFDRDGRGDGFRAINKWMRLSLLNRVFQRGRGWNPDRTGRRLIHEILKQHKGEIFPVGAILKLYSERLHWFDSSPKDDESRLNDYDRSFVYNSLYDADVTGRRNDADHIIAKHLLEQYGFDQEKINTISNFQLLFYSENRSKQDLQLDDWLVRMFSGDESKMREFAERHYIPFDRALWTPERYEEFLAERRKLIVLKLETLINDDRNERKTPL